MQQYTASKISLASPSSSIAEEYIPLLLFSYTVVNGTTSATSALVNIIQKGSTTTIGSITASTKLHTLGNWAAGTKFVFEAVIGMNAGGGTASAALFNTAGSGTVVAASQVSATSITPLRVRSGTFTLTSGVNYGITIWCDNSSFNAKIVSAKLVVVP